MVIKNSFFTLSSN